MSDFFRPENFWRYAGKTYEADHDTSLFVAQERELESVLREVPGKTVLEVGCGFGRVGEILREQRPGASYTGFDVSPDQIEGARRRLGDWAELYVESIVSFSGWRDVQGERRWDIVVAVEVLMHQPPEDIEEIIDAMFDWSTGHILTCDWSPTVANPGNEWNFPHDYRALFGNHLIEARRVGEQEIFVATGGPRRKAAACPD